MWLLVTAVLTGFFAVIFAAPLSAAFATTLAAGSITLAVLSLRED